ncbi:MAG: hypothetical protein ACPG6B_04985 [Oceanihabitans sp.]
MKKLVLFKKQRELSEILTDTFGFIREEFKPFCKAIFQISGLYLLLFLLSISFYIYSVGDLFNIKLDTNSGGFARTPLILGALLLFAIFGLLAYAYANSTVLHYIKSYVANEGKVNIEEVKQNVKSSIWGFLGLSILKWLTLIFAMIFCFFPVLYFMVPMFVLFSIYVFENKDATTAYSYSFTLIKNEYWITLATIFVIGLIVMFASYAFSIPATIYTFIKIGIFSGEVDPGNMQNIIDPVYILLNMLSYFAQFLLNLILTTASAFIYFNLNERINFTGTLEQIDSIGKNNM